MNEYVTFTDAVFAKSDHLERKALGVQANAFCAARK